MMNQTDWTSTNNPITEITHNNAITLTGSDNPERNAIISDLFSKLSEEAQMLISVIIHTPNELAQQMFGGVVTKQRVRKYLKIIGYTTREINITVTAIKMFCGDLTRI